MDFSVLVAKVVAIYLVLSGIFLVLRGKTFGIVVKDFFDHPAVVYIVGILLIGAGLVVIYWNDAWEGDFRNWISIIGAIMLIKGLAYLFVPNFLASMHLERSRLFIIAGGIIAIILGTVLYSIS